MKTRNLLITTALTAGLSTAAGAQIADAGNDAAEVMTTPDDGWITLTGEVTWTNDESFRLDYGSGLITVEMADFDGFDEAQYLLPCDDVVVYGLVDDDFYETRTIDAASVYVDDANTFVYADAVREDFTLGLYGPPAVEFDDPGVTVTGEVTSVDGREFVLSHGLGEAIEVDTASMSYNPMDDEGFQQIDAGDRVTVTGAIDVGFFDNNELSADAVVTIADAEPTAM